jgi:hypothetical protein
MKKGGGAPKKTKKAGAFTLGGARFAKISAVEGLTPSSGMKTRLREFDRNGTPAEERRREIIRSHSKR